MNRQRKENRHDESPKDEIKTTQMLRAADNVSWRVRNRFNDGRHEQGGNADENPITVNLCDCRPPPPPTPLATFLGGKKQFLPSSI